MSRFLHHDWIAFLTIGRTGSFSRAASILRTQQPGLSRRISRLEAQIGAKLFERTNRGARLTRIGENLYASLGAQNDTLESFLATALSESQIPQGIFKIGCHRAVGLSYLPQWMPGLLEKYKDLHFHFSFMESPKVTEKVTEGELDYGLIVNPAPFAGLIIHKIALEKISLFAAKPGKAKPQTIYYNPEMLMREKIKRFLADSKAVAVPDYDIAGALAIESPDCAVILPDTIGTRWGLNKRQEIAGTASEICLVYRESVRKSAVTRAILDGVRR